MFMLSYSSTTVSFMHFLQSSDSISLKNRWGPPPKAVPNIRVFFVFFYIRGKESWLNFLVPPYKENSFVIHKTCHIMFMFISKSVNQIHLSYFVYISTKYVHIIYCYLQYSYQLNRYKNNCSNDHIFV